MSQSQGDAPPDEGLIVAPIRVGVEKSWLQRLSKGLSRSSQALSEQVTAVLVKRTLDQAALDDLETMLIEADLGTAAAARVTAAFAAARFGREATEDEIKESLAEAVAGELRGHRGPLRSLAHPPPSLMWCCSSA